MAEPHDSTMARWNGIHTALFPWMREELDSLTEALERLIHVLDTIRLEAFVPPPPSGGRGRKPEDRRALARSFVAKAMLGLPTTIALIDRLATDQVLRRICGWEKRQEVPSEATFSRAFEDFAVTELAERMHAALIARSIGARIVGCVARDAPEIDAREKPAKKDDPPPPADPPRPRGRPKRARSGRSNPPAWSARSRKASTPCWPNYPPPATPEPKRTARAAKRAGRATNSKSTWRTGRFRCVAS
jgi:hypothetical protein